MNNRIVINLIASIFVWATLYSCSEEPVGQTPTDSTPPGKITNPKVENLPGGARISYTLPPDDDLLYVKAVYYINGVEKSATATLYNHSVEVMGYGSTNEQTVRLYCVDRSENYSEPVEVKIQPATPPVMLIQESMTMNAGFGGVQILWENKYKVDVVIYLIAADSIGDLTVVDEVYTSAVEGKFNLRGFDDTERLFGAFVRDRWDNYSDTLMGKFKPYYEMKLDKSLFRRYALLGDNTSDHSSFPITNMWNDNIFDFSHQDAAVDITPNYITIDLGVTAKLGRYTLWPRIGDSFEYVYAQYNLKKWKVWGVASLSSSNQVEYWIDGGFKDDWFLLADCYMFKPSGENNPVTQEDRDYAVAGFEFDIPLDAPPVRYIRFELEETWSGANVVVVGEVTFWGELVVEE